MESVTRENVLKRSQDLKGIDATREAPPWSVFKGQSGY